MQTFCNYEDIKFLVDILIKQGSHSHKLMEWVDLKIKEGILSPQKLTTHLTVVHQNFKLNKEILD